jgi:hypothetical protein
MVNICLEEFNEVRELGSFLKRKEAIMNNENEWFTPIKIAINLGIPETTVERWMKEGLQFSQMPGKVKLIHREWLDEFVRLHKVNEN